LADKSDSENKKIKVLKLLAIKAACFMQWNLSDLERRYICVVESSSYDVLAVLYVWHSWLFESGWTCKQTFHCLLANV